MLSESQEAALLNAVPSFEPCWRAWRADQAEYVARFPEAALTPAAYAHEFLSQLAHHLADRVAAGELGEAEWLFAALEGVYAEAGVELEAALTVGFLESLIYAVERRGGDAAALGRFARGPETLRGWRAAYGYTYPPGEEPAA